MRLLAGMVVFTLLVAAGVVGVLAASVIAVALIPVGLLFMPLLMLALYLVSRRPPPGWTVGDAGVHPIQIRSRRRTPTEPQLSPRSDSATDVSRRRAA
jgi:hypothetical protein